MIPVFTTLSVGVLNGYTKNEHGLPNKIKYGTLGITIFSATVKIIAKEILEFGKCPIGRTLGICISTPILMGMHFCMGHHMGKAIRYIEDDKKMI